MTEQEWLSSWDCRQMYSWMVDSQLRGSERCSRLFMIASCKLMEQTFFDPRLSECLAIAEICADNAEWGAALTKVGEAYVTADKTFQPHTDVERTLSKLNDDMAVLYRQTNTETPLDENGFRHYTWQALLSQAVSHCIIESPLAFRTGACGDSAQEVMQHIEMAYLLEKGLVDFCYGSEVTPVVRQSIADFIRDIFGNPFCEVYFDSSWENESVIGLANGIYADRAFERMPILADALQDAGCTNSDILNHCREPGTHVRGCWVVDLILGKE